MTTAMIGPWRAAARLFRRGKAGVIATLICATLTCAALAAGSKPAITVGATARDGAAITFRDVRIEYPGIVTIFAKAITADNLRAPEGARFQASRIAVEGVRIDPNTISEESMTVKAIEFIDVDAPLPTPEALAVDAGSGTIAPLVKTLLAVKASSIAMPEAAWEGRSPSSAASMVLGKLALTGIDQGRLEALTLDGLRFAIKETSEDSENKGGDFSLQSVRLEKINLTPVFAWFDDSLAAKAPKDKQPLYGAIALIGFHVQNDGISLDFHFSTRGGRLGTPPFAPSELWAFFQDDRVFKELPPSKRAAIVEGFVEALNFDDLELNDVYSGIVRGNKKEDILILEKLSLAGFSLPRLDAFSMGGLTLKTVDGLMNLKIGAFAIRGFDLDGWGDFLEAVQGGATSESLPIARYPKPRIASIELKDFEIKNENKHITIGGYRIEAPRWLGFLPTELKMTTNMTMSLEAIDDDKVKAALIMLGLKTVTSNQNLALAWDEKSETLTLAPSQASVEGVAKVEMAGTIGGVPRGFFEDPSSAKQSLAMADFRHLAVSIEDLGGVAKGLDAIATLLETTRSELASKTAAAIEGAFAGQLDSSEGREMAAALRTFVADPKSLRLSAKAEPPVPLRAFGALGEGGEGAQAAYTVIKKSLRFEAIANQ